jgi:hypothetical protein
MSFVHILSDNEPQPRWYRVTTISGKPAGLGFHCTTCGLSYRHSAPHKIFHCGKLEKAPLFSSGLPVRSLGGFQLPNRYVLTGAW